MRHQRGALELSGEHQSAKTIAPDIRWGQSKVVKKKVHYVLLVLSAELCIGDSQQSHLTCGLQKERAPKLSGVTSEKYTRTLRRVQRRFFHFIPKNIKKSPSQTKFLETSPFSHARISYTNDNHKAST